MVDAAAAITDAECADAERLDDELVEAWLGHRNDVSALEALISRGYVVDTMELTSSWAGLDALYARRPRRHRRRARRHRLLRPPVAQLPRRRLPLLHLRRPARRAPRRPTGDALYLACWDAGVRTALAHGGSLSHHHGIGLNRSRFVADALGPGATATLQAVKDALDPTGILNPGKLGFPSPFGAVPFPTSNSDVPPDSGATP